MNNCKKQSAQAAIVLSATIILTASTLKFISSSEGPNGVNGPIGSGLATTGSFHPPRNGPSPVLEENSNLLTTIVEKSNVIVVVTVTHSPDIKALLKMGNLDEFNQELHIDVQPQSIYKGGLNTQDKASVYFFLPKEAIGFVVPEEEKTYLLFLKRTQAGKLIFTDLQSPGIAVLPQRPDVAVGTSAIEAVADELLHNIQGGDENLIIGSLERLNVDSESLRVSRSLSRNPSLFVRAAAIAYRLRAKDVQAIDEAITVVGELNKPQLSEELTARSKMSIQDIAIVLPNFSDKISATQLMRLFDSKDATTQNQSEMYADSDAIVGEILRRIAVGEVKRPYKEDFVTVAMKILVSSKDKDAQYSALQLLSVIRGVNGPGIFDFAENPAKYVKEYEDWWNNQGKERFANSQPKN